MKQQLISTACAGLMSLALISPATADTINVFFSNESGDNVNYSFTTTATEITEDGDTFIEWSETFDSAVFYEDGVTTSYSSSEYQLSLGFSDDASVFDVIDFDAGETSSPLVRMLFDGEFFFNNDGVVEVSTFGDFITYSGDFVIDPRLDDGSIRPLLTLDGGLLSFSSLEVSTVSAVPVPAAVWLFGSGLIGLAGIARRKA